MQEATRTGREDAPSSSQQASHKTSSPPKARAPFLAALAISSFAAFRSQPAASAPAVQSPVRRKPLPPDSPVVGRYTPAELNSGPRPAAVDNDVGIPNPTPSQAPRRVDAAPYLPLDELDFVPRNLDEAPHGQTPLTANVPQRPFSPRKSSLAYSNKSPTSSRPRHDRSASSIQTRRQSRIEELKAAKGSHARSPTMPNMPLYTSEQRQPNLRLKLDGVTEDFIDDDLYETEEDRAEEVQPAKPKSPAAGFTSFFGWNSTKQSGSDSPTTTFSESLSPSASPRYPKQSNMPAKTKLTGLDIPMANSFAQPSYFNIPGTPLLSSSPQMNAHVEELERELREVSSELAASIRREMELEDEVERWKAESSSAMSLDNRRTSDYYSDSGTSSVRFPIGDPESKLEEVEMLRRKAEQERAQLKVHMAERLQDELRRRRDLEEQVQQLEDKVSGPAGSSDAGGPKVQELQASLDDAKRRLAEERQVKENFEDLLTALRQELEQHRNERDNLRDEIVPQLRARLEGLESEAANTQGLIYETSRMQQEIQQLRTENQLLQNARRMQQDTTQQQVRFSAIAEEGDSPQKTNPRVGLSRSNSLARSSGFNKRSSLQRSNSVKDRSGAESPRESPIAGSNPVKDLEEQRDALHKALKHLLKRQELQQRDFEKRIRELEIERDNALNLTPRRTAFHKEVTHLRGEVNSLRRRADDALEQKFQCENGLRGLRMDLDRAQQETSSLRELLKENDITIPEIRIDSQPPSLDKAFHELRTTHALSLARIKQMESEDGLGAAGEEAERTLDLLKQSISDAEAERDFAQKEAEQYRKQARALQKSEMEHLGKEQKLSTELYAAATRMDELSERIQQQLDSNSALRKRLTDAVSRGEQEQEKSAEKIIELERRLKTAEDKVMIAQQSSEEAITRHEEEVKAIKESHNNHLHRVKSGLLSPGVSPRMPSSPVFAQRSPRLGQTTSGPAMSMAEATKTGSLEKRVEELEKALRDADHEMEEVVGRMNMAQIEVADLQFQRDEAMRMTRRLQADILAEREKVKALMARN
ncbi:hypothetical protein K458DRAFT_426445 [Lentithecium fluviatile CBS 122367]|uniref:DUF7603 domain-containing protein n=1 Tax=Lentithecium fluviatile CBS 122367 TaxID=1168545 RepID=A0A6G1JLR2_9PLEO|nr:hypothetical protein K458DRAFT_426445 [Lentithecium fluviatile CBS 122367]